MTDETHKALTETVVCAQCYSILHPGVLNIIENDTKLIAKKGFSVKIYREDGRSFFAISDGDFPPIWVPRNRKYAAAFKREIVSQGFNAKVVPVQYIEPWEEKP